MFIIKTYLKKPDIIITDLDQINENSKKYFIDLEDETSIVKLKDRLDFFYIEGVIYMEYQLQILMDFRYWDIVDSLWSYFIKLADDFIKNNESKIYFPDQPIQLVFSPIKKDYLLFSIIENNKVNKYFLPKKEFLYSILYNGEIFFRTINKYFPCKVNYTYELNMISEIKRKMGFNSYTNRHN